MYKLKKNQVFGHLLLSLFVCRSLTIQKVKKNSQKLSGQLDQIRCVACVERKGHKM